MRYLRLYLQFIKFSFGKATAFRFDFWCRILMDLAYYVVSIAFFKILFLETPILGGWNEHQVMIFVGAHLVLDAIQMTMLSSNLWELPSAVNRGEVDYYLVKPVSTLFFLSFREFAINSVINLFIAGGFLAWALSEYPEPYTAMRLVSFLSFLLLGFVLYYGLRLLVSLPVFWLQSPYGLERIFYSMMPFMERPDAIFRGTMRLIILTVIPFGLMVSFPARIFFEGLTLERAFHMIAVTVVLWAIVLFIWRAGLRNYSSASS